MISGQKLNAQMRDGILEIWDLFEEGGWIIRVQASADDVHKRIALFEVPMYGGEERFSGFFPNILDAIKEGQSWT